MWTQNPSAAPVAAASLYQLSHRHPCREVTALALLHQEQNMTERAFMEITTRTDTAYFADDSRLTVVPENVTVWLERICLVLMAGALAKCDVASDSNWSRSRLALMNVTLVRRPSSRLRW